MPSKGFTGLQLCTVDDLTGEPQCRRLAQWEWKPDPDGDPVFLCNFHAEPLTAEMPQSERVAPDDGHELS